MKFAEAKQKSKDLWDAHTVAAEPLGNFPKGAMGMTPDSVRATPEWKKAYAAERKAFHELRAFNAWYTKEFKSEIAADRREKYAQRVAQSKK